MLAMERRSQILARLQSEGNVVVADLSRLYRVTEETIRRDLDKLEQEGYARKTYGGAVRAESSQVDLPYIVRTLTHVDEKQAIANLIAARVPDGASLALDASSSALFAARALLGKKRLSLITNSIEILTELVGKTDWNILSTGGTLKGNGLALIGPPAERMIENFHVNWAVLSSKGLDASMGFMDANEQDAQIKRAFIRQASHTVFLVDSSKFNQQSFVQIAPLGAAEWIVTDAAPDALWIDRLNDAGVSLLTPQAEYIQSRTVPGEIPRDISREISGDIL
ncbi:MAG: DeoR/GlpR family DNA-binding transcription regulator [Oscillospiraceae bacterium]|jgi:DeoR/GlpR family transcriptional regulator of sugar metabolism|nr:DeoR/GlpR family DNA-binding transcription regulator [Oscillospiraceae bacterium]